MRLPVALSSAKLYRTFGTLVMAVWRRPKRLSTYFIAPISSLLASSSVVTPNLSLSLFYHQVRHEAHPVREIDTRGRALLNMWHCERRF